MKGVKRTILLILVLVVVYYYYGPTLKQKLENLTVAEITEFIDQAYAKGDKISDEIGEWMQQKFSSSEEE